METLYFISNGEDPYPDIEGLHCDYIDGVIL